MEADPRIPLELEAGPCWVDMGHGMPGQCWAAPALGEGPQREKNMPLGWPR